MLSILFLIRSQVIANIYVRSLCIIFKNNAKKSLNPSIINGYSDFCVYLAVLEVLLIQIMVAATSITTPMSIVTISHLHDPKITPISISTVSIATMTTAYFLLRANKASTIPISAIKFHSSNSIECSPAFQVFSYSKWFIQHTVLKYNSQFLPIHDNLKSVEDRLKTVNKMIHYRTPGRNRSI